MKCKKIYIVIFFIMGIIYMVCSLIYDNKKMDEKHERIKAVYISGVISKFEDTYSQGNFIIKLKGQSTSYRFCPFPVGSSTIFFDDIVQKGDSVYKKENSNLLELHHNGCVYLYELY